MKWLNISDILKNYYFTVWLQNTHMQIYWGKKGNQWFQSSDYSIFLSPSAPARSTLLCCASQVFSLASEQQNAATLCGSWDKFCLIESLGPTCFLQLAVSVEHQPVERFLLIYVRPASAPSHCSCFSRMWYPDYWWVKAERFLYWNKQKESVIWIWPIRIISIYSVLRGSMPTDNHKACQLLCVSL